MTLLYGVVNAFGMKNKIIFLGMRNWSQVPVYEIPNFSISARWIKSWQNYYFRTWNKSCMEFFVDHNLEQNLPMVWWELQLLVVLFLLFVPPLSFVDSWPFCSTHCHITRLPTTTNAICGFFFFWQLLLFLFPLLCFMTIGEVWRIGYWFPCL